MADADRKSAERFRHTDEDVAFSVEHLGHFNKVSVVHYQRCEIDAHSVG